MLQQYDFSWDTNFIAHKVKALFDKQDWGFDMNKEEILDKSRKENKNKDIFEQEVLKQGNSVANFVMIALATVFFVVQIFTGGGINYGIYAIVFSGSMATFWIKWFRLRQKHELVMAFLYTIIVVAFSTAHIYDLIIL